MTLTASDARHLLRRTGFGGLPAEVDDLTGKTRAQAVASAVSAAGYTSGLGVPAATAGNVTGQRREMQRWWADVMAGTPAPMVEKLVYFWHSHFACTTERVRDFRNMRDQHARFRQYGLGPFEPLLREISFGAAMLIDLDNASNVAGDEQENFARELMELYTIGNGMFTEDEVIAMARAWTGHNLEQGAKPPRYQFHSNRHDKHEKTLFGIEANWDAPETITELVNGVRKDQTAWYLATKLWREFGDPAWASAELITHLADVWKANDSTAWDVLEALFLRDEFWAPERRYAVVKQPLPWIVELERRTGIRNSAGRLDGRLSVLGQQMFLPPSVAGWGHNGAWLSAAGLLGRARIARDMSDAVQKTGVFDGLRDNNTGFAVERILAFFGVPDASAQTRDALETWHTSAIENLNNYWTEREAFRVGALLPEVNLA
ncbi:MAG: DUF1800 family protein [Actinomycetota bacterium]